MKSLKKKKIHSGAEYKVVYNKGATQNDKLIDKIKMLSKDLIPDAIVLAVGAQVVFKKNINDMIANGTRGVVTSFGPGWISFC